MYIYIYSMNIDEYCIYILHTYPSINIYCICTPAKVGHRVLEKTSVIIILFHKGWSCRKGYQQMRSACVYIHI